MVRQWWKKLRGLTGLTAVGGFLGGLFGSFWVGLNALLAGATLSLELLVMGAVIHGGFAALATAGVGVLLASVGSKKNLSQLSAWKAGLCGALVGASAPALLLALPGVVPVAVLASVGVRFGLLGGALGAGLVTVAKRSEARQLMSSQDTLLASGE